MDESGLFAKIDSFFGDKGFQFGTKVPLSDEEIVCLKEFLIKELLSVADSLSNEQLEHLISIAEWLK